MISGTSPCASIAIELCAIAAVFLSRWYQLVVDNVDDIAIIMSAESGKPVKESKVEATGG